MKFYTEFKLRTSAFGGGFTNGMTMTGSESVTNCRKSYEDNDKTVFEYGGDCVAECFHVNKGDVTECFTKFTYNGESAVDLDMLSSFAIRNIHANVIHRAASFWSAEGRLISERLVDMNMEEAWCEASVRSEKFGQIGSMPVRKWFRIFENRLQRNNRYRLRWSGKPWRRTAAGGCCLKGLFQENFGGAARPCD